MTQGRDKPDGSEPSQSPVAPVARVADDGQTEAARAGREPSSGGSNAGRLGSSAAGAASFPGSDASSIAGPENWAEPARRAPVPDGDEEAGLCVEISGFSGPLDLLLALARTQKVDLAHISIVELTDQYLAYIREAQRIRLALAADYLVMAAWLTFLKSRLLLPRDEEQQSEIPAEELARRLAFRLVRLDAMRRASTDLMARVRLGQDVFNRGQEEAVTTIRERVYTGDLYELLKAYTRQRNRTATRVHTVRARVVWSIKDARRRLEKMVGKIQSTDWVQLEFCLEQFLPAAEEGRTVLAASFGASLEMAREGLVDLRQTEAFAPIYLRPSQRENGDGENQHEQNDEDPPLTKG